ncbi:MAG TPA: hypothetical protein VK123_03225 [Candidatus Limnocylindrales bacterium]|nr:hypothetical protein [Candidatus Limnocylindrales bacterium]
MFHVENADFIADKLSAELLPNQEYREVLKNALEAVERRMDADGSKTGGRVEFDVDWTLHALDEAKPWYLACSDNGDGMSRTQLAKYTTTLAVQGAGRNQSIRGNQGMGLKISGPTRHKRGVLIRSSKAGEGTRVQIGWDGSQYGLIPIGNNDELVLRTPPAAFPDIVNEQGSGTVVTFLGNKDGDNTFVPAWNPKGWLLRYLNSRFFRLSTNGIDVVVRVPSGDQEEWPHNLDEAKERMRGKGRSFNLTKIDGTAGIWDDAADRQGTDWRGVIDVAGDQAAGIPPARVHWWVLPPTGAGTDVSSRTASGGSLAVLFDNELHDWRSGNQSNPFFARLGILFGKTRIAFVLEPLGASVAADFARAHVLVGGTPVLQSDAWLRWTEEFREQMPEAIRRTILEEQARLEVEDPDRAKRIRERLRDVMQMLRPRFFRRQQAGVVRAVVEVTGAQSGDGVVAEYPKGSSYGYLVSSQSTGRGRGIGAVLSQIDDEAGEPAVEVSTATLLSPRWVTEQEAEGLPIVKGNTHGLRDRAAALVGTDGRTASLLLLNREFRGYQAILAAMNAWANPEGDADKAARIKSVAEEWVEQKMIEAVEGLWQLENGRTWITEQYDEALSPVSLTAVFMADRYHTVLEVKRAIGALRDSRRSRVEIAGG